MNEDYVIVTKEQYIRRKLNKLDYPEIDESTLDGLKEDWNEMSEGYNYMIGAGEACEEDDSDYDKF